MTREEMVIVASDICSRLDAQDAGIFAGVLKETIMSSYSDEELELIDALLYYQGVDVNPVCRKKHPPAPPPR